eukprot:TRINITY_DN717_c0_g1_i1.p1 TRINITY_DN717_c0_g1~~TRINITY_DN717_c0_g1_i1.p1  ORF type:complete len:822 (+),score=134.04 TRINITY_DN717_c0_g1_i1:9098-11563(+)
MSLYPKSYYGQLTKSSASSKTTTTKYAGKGIGIHQYTHQDPGYNYISPAKPSTSYKPSPPNPSKNQKEMYGITEKFRVPKNYQATLASDYVKNLTSEKAHGLIKPTQGYEMSPDKVRYIVELKDALQSLNIYADPGADQTTDKVIKLVKEFLGKVSMTLLRNPEEFRVWDAKEDLRKEGENFVKQVKTIEPAMMKALIEEIRKRKNERGNTTLNVKLSPDKLFYKRPNEEFMKEFDSIINDTKQEYVQIQQELEKAKKEVSNLYLQLQKEQGKTKNLADANSKLQLEKKKMEAQRYNLESHEKGLRNRYQLKVSSFKARFTSMTNQLKVLQEFVVKSALQQSNKVQLQTAKVKKLKETVKASNNVKGCMQGTISNLNKHISELNDTIKQLKESNASLKSKPAVSTSFSSPLKEGYDTLKVKYEKLQTKVIEMKQQLKKSLLEVQKLKPVLRNIEGVVHLYKEHIKKFSADALKHALRLKPSYSIPSNSVKNDMNKEDTSQLSGLLLDLNPKLQLRFVHNPPLTKLISLVTTEVYKVKESKEVLESEMAKVRAMELKHKAVLENVLKAKSKLEADYKEQVQKLERIIEKFTQKHGIAATTSQEEEELMEELIIKNVKLEGELNLVKAEISTKDKEIENMAQKCLDNSEEFNTIKNAVDRLYTTIYGKPLNTRKIGDIVDLVYKRVQEILADKSLGTGITREQLEEALQEKSLLEAKLKEMKAELDQTKENDKAAEDLLVKVCELDEKVEDLEKDKAILEESKTKLLEENKECKEMLETCTRLTEETIRLTRASPERTKKLVNLCVQLKREVEKTVNHQLNSF